MWWKYLAGVASVCLTLGGCQAPQNAFEAGMNADPGNTTAGVHLAAARMPDGQQVTPPYGYIGFCLRDPKECEGGTNAPRDVAMNPQRWAELNKVNDWVNRNVPQYEDTQLFGRSEWWTIADPKIGGDCEDLALLKQKMLEERGWPLEALTIAVVREWNGAGHAVLVVATDKGDLVLDNKNWKIVSWQDAPYSWVKRQSRKRPYIWVSLDTNKPATLANATLPPLGAEPPFLVAAHRVAKLMAEMHANRENSAGLRPTVTGDETSGKNLAKVETPTAALSRN